MTDRGSEILGWLFDYLDGLTSLPALRSWASGLAADSHQWGDPEAERWATELLVLFSEAETEGWSESEFRDECVQLVLTLVSPGSVAYVPAANSTIADSGPRRTTRTRHATPTEARTITLRAA